MPSSTWPRPLPAGVCWCGCGTDVPSQSFFLQGHDKAAESAVIRAKYGTVADFLAAHGYGPDGDRAIEARPRA